MRGDSKKKFAFRILIGFIVVIIFGIAAFLGYREYLHQKQQRMVANLTYIQKIQSIEAMITNIEMNESRGIPCDAELISAIKDEVEEMQKLFDYKGKLLETMRMIHICTYLDMPYAEKLKDKIMEFYSEKTDAFFDSTYEVNQTVDKKAEIRSINSTISVAGYLAQYIPPEKYDIVSKCAEWYQQYIPMECGEDDATSDIAGDCFWFLYEQNAIERIDYQKMLPYMKEDIKKEEKDIQEGKNCMNTVFSAATYTQCQKLFGLDAVQEGLAQQFYEKLDSEDDFEYEPMDDISLLLLNSNLKEVDDISKNTYYVAHIQEWLWDYYHRFVE